MMWVLKDAVALVQRMQSGCMEAGYYIALAGGVLNKGFSETDLDLVAMPRTKDAKLVQLVAPLMRACIYVETATYEDCYAHWICHHLPGKSITKKVEISIPRSTVPFTVVDPVNFRFD